MTLIQFSFPGHMLNKVRLQPPQINSLLSSFTPAAFEEVRQIIMYSPNTFCDLDAVLSLMYGLKQGYRLMALSRAGSIEHI